MLALRLDVRGSYFEPEENFLVICHLSQGSADIGLAGLRTKVVFNVGGLPSIPQPS